MNTRALPIITGLVTLAILIAMGFAIAFIQRPARNGNNFLTNPPDMVDQLVMFDSAKAFTAGQTDNVALDESSATIILQDKRENSFPRSGTWTGPEQTTPFPFTEALPSWNVLTPKDTGARFHIRVRDHQTGEWSPWLYMGQWGRTTSRKDHTTKFDGGEVNIDTLTLTRPADAFQMRATLESFEYDPKVTPTLRRVSVCYSGEVPDAQQRGELAPATQVPQNWDRDLGVKFRAQADSHPRIKGEVCSPTSTSMVMEYAGVSLPTLENATAIYDNEYNLFGNWNRAVARAGELGLDAWLTRFRSWDQVKATIAQGQPIVASIRFAKGEMPNNPLYQDTDGHLIVIRGLTKDGDVIVNDPARKEAKEGKPNGNGVVYKADELARAWFNKGGVAYIIRKPAKPATLPTTKSS